MVAAAIQQIHIGKSAVPVPLSYVAAMGMAAAAIWMVVVLVNANIENVVAVAPAYQERLQSLIGRAYSLAGVTEPMTLS